MIIKPIKKTKKQAVIIRKNKAITLIALIITIIILLVLAGVTIAALSGDDGLFFKTKQAAEKYAISEAKEKLTTKLMKLQTEVTQEEQRNATIEDIDKLMDVNSKYYDEEIESVKSKKENKIVKISGYYFEIDNKLNIVGNIDAAELAVTETTYKVNSINGNIMSVTVNIKNEIGIQKVTKPDNIEITPSGSKEQITIDYDVEDGKEYIFKVQLIGSKEQKEYVLKANLNAKPEIKQNESDAYPTLTDYGVELNKIVKIDYGENTDNYYSLDNGNNWVKYTENGINVKKEGKIFAKSVINGEITKLAQEDISMQLADNALDLNAYDDDENTSAEIPQGGGKKRIYLDESVKGKNIYVSYIVQAGSTGVGYASFYTEDDTEISTAFGGQNTYLNRATYSQVVRIPDNADYIECIENGSGTFSHFYILEIQFANEPEFNIEKTYPILTDNGIIQPYCSVSISYSRTSEQKLYKIDDGEWNNYTDAVKIKIGQKITAKGINKDGKETRIETSYTATTLDDALGPKAYDNDENTSEEIPQGGGKKRIYLDESVKGKNIYVSYTIQAGDPGVGYASFYTEDGTEISTAFGGQNTHLNRATYSQVVSVPDNADYIECIEKGSGTYSHFYILEIRFKE